MDRTMRAAATIEQMMLDDIDAAYHDILAPVLRKHRKNLAQLEKLMQAGQSARARVLWRKSGIITDLAEAIAAAGTVSSAAIRRGLAEIREVAADDD